MFELRVCGLHEVEENPNQNPTTILVEIEMESTLFFFPHIV